MHYIPYTVSSTSLTWIVTVQYLIKTHQSLFCNAYPSHPHIFSLPPHPPLSCLPLPLPSHCLLFPSPPLPPAQTMSGVHHDQPPEIDVHLSIFDVFDMHCVLHTVHCTVHREINKLIKNTTYNKKRFLLLFSLIWVGHVLYPLITFFIIQLN